MEAYFKFAPVDKSCSYATAATHKDIEMHKLLEPRKFFVIYLRYNHTDPELRIVSEPEKLETGSLLMFLLCPLQMETLEDHALLNRSGSVLLLKYEALLVFSNL
ncbi:hypothetical protein AVEN_126000-1 [Araneus ventricosus]|uniref:Uncharacterized protein n=1 Tax=Araneus ventricosus TaxID=182803 RepID=A0A4Y2QA35_ARAVE|nr:hypothetical protein AVEN_126000-1 [Araneus ventricosus]